MNATNTTTAAALFLLSLTIGNTAAAQIYTNDPETIAQAAKAENPQAVATWEEVATPADLPAADVPALIL